MLQNPRLAPIAIAVAIAAGLYTPMAAQAQSNVTIYGKLYPQLVRADVSGATAAGVAVSRLSATPVGGADYTINSEDSPNSRLGFRGSEKLGGDLKAIFQLELGFGVDTGANSSATNLFSRDTWVGLEGGFGTVRLGSMDTVYKNLGETLSFLGISSGNFISASNVLSKPGFGSSSAASFHLRRGNSIVYESPEYANTQFLFDYSLGEVANDFTRGAVISAGVKYEAGPVYAAIAYERHNDLFGGSKSAPSALRNDANARANSRDSALRATVQYKFTKQTRGEINIANLTYEETGGGAGKFDSYEHMAWSVAVEHKITPAVTLVGSYAQGTDGTCTIIGTTCSTNGLEGKMLNLGAGYHLSKRTLVYALASHLGNGVSATYSNLNNGKPLPGQDTNTLALGISHSF